MPQTNVTHSHRSIYIVSPYMCSSSSQQSLHYSNICRLILFFCFSFFVFVGSFSSSLSSFAPWFSSWIFEWAVLVFLIRENCSMRFGSFQKSPDTFRYISIHFDTFLPRLLLLPKSSRYISIHFDTFRYIFDTFFFCDPPPLCRCMCGGAAVCAAMPLDAGNNMFAFLQFVQRHVLMRVSRLLRHALQHKSSKGVQ